MFKYINNTTVPVNPLIHLDEVLVNLESAQECSEVVLILSVISEFYDVVIDKNIVYVVDKE